MRLALFFLALPALAVTISTAHIDNGRSGWNDQEVLLTPSNVAGGHFGKLGSYALDGKVYGQPLYIPAIAGHDLIIAATMHGSVYALDANTAGKVIWGPITLVTPRTVYPYADNTDVYYNQEIGCKATPVVDVPNGWVFASCANSTPNTIVSRVDLATGANLIQRTIAGTVSGTGDPASDHANSNSHNISLADTVSGGVLSFNPVMQSSNTALALIAGVVYVGFGSYVDYHPYHGWLFALNESLVITAVFCSTPNGGGGGIWMGASGGVSSDGTDVYAVTGNGDYDGTANWGMSALRMNSSLAILDWFTPSNYAAMNAADSDLGSGAAIQIPSSNRIVLGSKDYRIFNLDRTCMGHLGGAVGGCGGAEIFGTDPIGSITDHSGIYNGLYFNGSTYFPNTNGKIYKNTITAGTFDETAVTSAATYEFPGAQMAASSNGTSNGVIWAVVNSVSALFAEQQGTLVALNPSDMSVYYTSATRANDALGLVSKYAAPSPANGKVYVSAGSAVVVYGLLPTSRTRGSIVMRGKVVMR